MGSALIAFGFIPPMCILAVSAPIELELGPILRDIGFYILTLVLMLVFASDGQVDVAESGSFLAIYFVYLLVVMFMNKGVEKAEKINREEVHVSTRILDYGSIVDLEDTDLIGYSPNPKSKEDISDDDLCGLSVMSEDDRSCTAYVSEILLKPVELLYSYTIPDCEEEKSEKYYLLTFLISLVYVCVLSEIVMMHTITLSESLHIPHEISGVIVLAFGAQTPDTIESVSMAKCGKGNGAMSNAFSSQIINVVGGIALPYAIYTITTGEELTVNINHIMAIGVPLGVVICTFLSLSLCGYNWKHKTVSLASWQGNTLLSVYVLATFGCIWKISNMT